MQLVIVGNCALASFNFPLYNKDAMVADALKYVTNMLENIRN